MALASLIVYPTVADIHKAFPNVDPSLIGPRYRVSGDAAVPAGGMDRTDGGRLDRCEFVDDSEPSQLGRVLLGARFLQALFRRSETEKHYVMAGPIGHRAAVRVLSAALVFALQTAKKSFI